MTKTKRVVLAVWAVLFLLFWIAALSEAREVTPAWDSPSNEPTLDGYRLFWRIEGTPYDYSKTAGR